MGLFKKLSELFNPPTRGEPPSLWVSVRCKRCGEVVKTRLSSNNDLSAEYDGDATTYVCRKILVGEERCFQQIEVVLKFDANRKLIERAVSGGEFVSEEKLPQSPGD